MPLPNLFTFSRATTPAQSATTYVPIVILSRALAFLRVLLVARILGNAGQREFGLYQPALELINWIAPLIMFGLADVAERYAARLEIESRLLPTLKRHLIRLIAAGLLAILALLIASPYLTYPILKLPSTGPDAHSQTYGLLLLAACSLTILLLALYQYLAALLRGLRAYAPAAGMEITSALLLLLLSTLASWRGGAIDLIVAYALSILLPTIYFGSQLLTHLKSLPAASSNSPFTIPHSQFNRFAFWSLLRLLLVTTFGFLSIWSIGHLAPTEAQSQTAAYAMPYRIAQLLAYLAVTLWASCYGIATRHWSHHQTRRAKVQLFRVGKFGAVLLTLTAILLLLTRNLLAHILPSAYTASINQLLPPLLALFIWYGLLAFACTYADLQESPHKSAALWFTAVALQLTLILLPNSLTPTDPKMHVLLASALGLAASLLILSPLLLWHSPCLSGTSLPLFLLALTPLPLLSPPWVVDLIAPPIMLAAIAFLYVTGLLIRPLDRRAWRRFRQPKHASHAQ